MEGKPHLKDLPHSEFCELFAGESVEVRVRNSKSYYIPKNILDFYCHIPGLLLLNKTSPINFEDTTEGDFEDLLGWMIRGPRSPEVERLVDVDLVTNQTPPTIPSPDLSVPEAVVQTLENFKDTVREGFFQQQFRLQGAENSADEIGSAQKFKSSKKRKLAPEDEIAEDGSESDDSRQTDEVIPTDASDSTLPLTQLCIRDYIITLRHDSFETLLKLLVTEVTEIRKSKTRLNKFLAIMSMITRRCHSLDLKMKRKRERKPHPRTADEMNLLIGVCEKDGLKIKKSDEDIHPWKVDRNVTRPAIALRVWDHISKCKILNSKEGFLSGSSFEWLDTGEKRRTALQNHANWGNRIATPFISTTTDLSDAATDRIPHLLQRQRRNFLMPEVKVTIINANARRAAGMPVLNMREELEHYKARIPYEFNHKWRRNWYDKEYIFPFRIPAEQIVGTWLWSEIQTWLRDHLKAELPDLCMRNEADRETRSQHMKLWSENVAIPEFDRHELARTTGQEFIRTHCICCGMVGEHHLDSYPKTVPSSIQPQTTSPDLGLEPTPSVATETTQPLPVLPHSDIS